MMDEPDRDGTGKARLEAAYDKFAARVSEGVAAGRQEGAQVLAVAMEKARAGLTAAGEITAAQGEQLKRHLQRDLEHLSQQVRAAGREARPWLDPQRLRDGALAGLATVLHALGGTLEAWSRRADEAVIYEAGQITSAGTLTCLNCGRVIHLAKTSHVPPCPDCLAARFRKSY